MGEDLPQEPGARAMADLAACGVIAEGEPFSEPLTRADAAELLLRALEVLEASEK